MASQLNEKLSTALQALVTPVGTSLLHELTGASKERTVSVDTDAIKSLEVKCESGHACTQLTERPPEYPPGPVWCNRCSDNGIEASYKCFYHCTTCGWDTCLACTSGILPVGCKNAWISPISIALCMGMVACGATPGSTTHEELRKCLGHTILGQEPLALAACLRITDAITQDGSSGAEVICANSAWVGGIGMARGWCREEYLAAVEAFFDAKVEPLPSDPGPINEWVERKTKGKITEILEDLDPGTSIVLVNAIYFKGTWAKQFDRKATRETEFYRLSGTTMCQMMSREDKKMLYLHANLPGSDICIQACCLRYGNSPISALVVLPSEWGSTPIRNMLLALNASSWATLTSTLSQSEAHVRLQLPRFKLDSGLMNLNETLKELGIHAAWSGGFNRMSQHHTQLQDVFHRAICEVDEDGTVAAAATAAVMGKGKPAQPISMECNRPFLFAIVHNLGGAPLFWGIVGDPSQ